MKPVSSNFVTLHAEPFHTTNSFLSTLFILIFFFLLQIENEAQSTWKEINTGVTYDLNSICCHSDNQTIWACGANGTIIRSTDCGDTWTKLIINTTQTLWDIIVLENNIGAAVGNNGTILWTTNGTDWTLENSGTTDNLYGVTGYYSTSGSGKVDRANSYLSDWEIFAGGSRYTIVAKTNQSSSWVTQQNYPNSTGYLGAMCYPYAFGDYGGIYKYENGQWNYSDPIHNMGDFMTGFVYGNKVWVAGSGASGIFSSNNGATWTQINIGSSNSAFRGMRFTDENTGYVSGYAGEIRGTTNGGQTWPLQTSNTTKNLGRMSGNSRGVFISGSEGKIITNKTNGYTLTLKVLPPEAAAKGAKANANPLKSEYNQGEVVNLSAVDGQEGWTFKQWTGDVTGTNRTVTLNMTGDKKNKEVTANFVQPILTVMSLGPLRKVYCPEEAHDKFLKVMDLTLTANEIDDWMFQGVKFKNLIDKKSIKSAKIVKGTVEYAGTISLDTTEIQFRFSPNIIVPKSGSIIVSLYYGINLPKEDQLCDMNKMRTYRAEISIGSNVDAIPLLYNTGLKTVSTPMTSSHCFVACVENSSHYGFNTIQEAIDSPLSGVADIHSVCKGEYNLTQTVNVNKPHSIISKAGKDVTKIIFPYLLRWGVFDIRSDDLTIDGFTIDPFWSHHGIRLSNTPKNITIKNCYFTRTKYGVWCDSLSGTGIIENNKFDYCEWSLVLNKSENIHIRSNQFHAYPSEIHDFAVMSDSSNNIKIYSNLFYIPKDYASLIHIGKTSSNNEIYDNIDINKRMHYVIKTKASTKIYNNKLGALVLDGAENVWADNNEFRSLTSSYSNKNIFNRSKIDSSDQEGLWIVNSHDNEFNNTEISKRFKSGIYLSKSENNKFVGGSIDSAFYGIDLENSNKNYFSNYRISHSSHNGVQLLFSSENNFDNNIIYNSKDVGVEFRIGSWRDSVGSKKNIFRNNKISYSRWDGIKLHWGRNTYNTFYGNEIFSNGASGIYVQDALHQRLISNRIYKNSEYGIEIHISQNDIISNTVYNNAKGGIICYGNNKILSNVITDHKHGIGLEFSFRFHYSTSEIEIPSIVRQNVLLRNCTGVKFNARSNELIENNIIKDSYCTTTGIHLYNSSVSLKNNDISNNKGYGLLLENSTASITSNNIHGNSGYAIGVASGSQVTNADGNYWGNNGPTSGMFQGEVKINSWLPNPFALQVSTKESTIYVNNGTTDSTEVYIKNSSIPSDQVRLTVTDEKGWLINNNPVTVNVKDTIIIPVTVKFQIPSNATSQYQNKVKLNAVSLTNPQITAKDSFYVFNYTSQLKSLEIYPDSISITYRDTIKFSVLTKDQHDKDFIGPLKFLWSSNKSIIDSNGVFIAGSSDELITIIVTDKQSGIKDTAHISHLSKVGALTSFIVTPDSVELKTGEYVQFYHSGLDKYGFRAECLGTWNANGGVIDNEGRYIAGNALGHYTVTFLDTIRNKSTSAHVWISGVSDVEEFALPTEYSLTQNYPNPFNPSTKINYSLPFESKVKMEVYNILGQRIDLLIDEVQSAGTKLIEWYASKIASGVYLIRLIAEPINTGTKTYISTIKIMHLK